MVIWPVYTRFDPPYCKHLGLTELSEFCSEPRFVVVISWMSPGRTAHILTETDV